MNKNRIRLTESQLHRVIKESVKKILKEDYWHDKYYDEVPDANDEAEFEMEGEVYFYDPKNEDAECITVPVTAYTYVEAYSYQVEDYDGWDREYIPFREVDNEDFLETIEVKELIEKMKKKGYLFDDYDVFNIRQTS